MKSVPIVMCLSQYTGWLRLETTPLSRLFETAGNRIPLEQLLLACHLRFFLLFLMWHSSQFSHRLFQICMCVPMQCEDMFHNHRLEAETVSCHRLPGLWVSYQQTDSTALVAGNCPWTHAFNQKNLSNWRKATLYSADSFLCLNHLSPWAGQIPMLLNFPE